MCVMINMPPALEREAQEYATVQGATLERIFLNYLKRELARRRAAEEWEAKFDRLVESSSSRMAEGLVDEAEGGQRHHILRLTHSRKNGSTNRHERCHS